MKQFLFRLCLAIGGDSCVHPDFLATVLNRRQIYEWIAYAKLFPFGEERADFRHALQTFFIRAAWVGDEADEKPEDFMPRFDNEPLKTDAQLILDEIKELL